MPGFKIVVISLVGSVERRKSITDMLQGCTWPWQFFDACSNADNTLPYDDERTLVRRGYKMKPAEIGAFASHYACLRAHAMSAESPDYMLVLEDDILLDKSYDFPALLGHMDKLGIHYLKLSSGFINRPRFIGMLPPRALLRFAVPSYGTQAYMISKTGAQCFMKTITRIERPIDDEMDRYWVHGLPSYALFPYPAIELAFPSTIPKGYTQTHHFSATQKIQAFIFKWLEKMLREWANICLRKKDCEMAHTLKEIL